jgi:hypothetical protein
MIDTIYHSVYFTETMRHRINERNKVSEVFFSNSIVVRPC